jgi:hypothetical protein
MKNFHPFGTLKNFDVGTAKLFCDLSLTANFSKFQQKKRQVNCDRPQNSAKFHNPNDRNIPPLISGGPIQGRPIWGGANFYAG